MPKNAQLWKMLVFVQTQSQSFRVGYLTPHMGKDGLPHSHHRSRKRDIDSINQFDSFGVRLVNMLFSRWYQVTFQKGAKRIPPTQSSPVVRSDTNKIHHITQTVPDFSPMCLISKLQLLWSGKNAKKHTWRILLKKIKIYWRGMFCSFQSRRLLWLSNMCVWWFVFFSSSYLIKERDIHYFAACLSSSGDKRKSIWTENQSDIFFTKDKRQHHLVRGQRLCNKNTRVWTTITVVHIFIERNKTAYWYLIDRIDLNASNFWHMKK